MSLEPSANVRLYGTEESPETTQIVSAGSLSIMLHSGNLRYVTFGDREAIRAIAFVVRDEDWGTYIPSISDLEVDSGKDGFRITYNAKCGDGGQFLAYTAVIEGSADGSVSFVVSGAAETPFLTSRTGFVILHPINGTAGAPVEVTHTDGSTEHSVFPELIKPSQPFQDISALSHEVEPGLSVTCSMEGDTFEMEDQRNWSDASFKTYIRPLSKPHPFILEQGVDFHQRVSLSARGPLPDPGSNSTHASASVSIGDDVAGRIPQLALAAYPDYAEAALRATALVKHTDVDYLICSFDASAGHDAETMALFKRLGEETGAGLILESVLPLRDARSQFTGDWQVLQDDVAAVRRCADDAGVVFEGISVSPACYHKSFQPVDDWPSAPPLREVYASVRQAFPDTKIAGGMHSYFTEFNRFPPPVDTIDLVTHTTCPIVHAADDLSVMESLQALPSIFESACTLANGKPYWIGPTAIGMRMNPYGIAPKPNPRNIRGAMVTVDPRQRGLFNAAWTLGYIARAAAGDVTGLCLSAIAGPFGITWQKMSWSQPWYDESGSENTVFPVYHVIAGLASRAGAAVRTVRNSNEAALVALALDSAEGRELWMANLTADKLSAELHGDWPQAMVERLDSETFEHCCSGPDGFSSTATKRESTRVQLNAYAVLRIY